MEALQSIIVFVCLVIGMSFMYGAYQMGYDKGVTEKSLEYTKETTKLEEEYLKDKMEYMYKIQALEDMNKRTKKEFEEYKKEQEDLKDYRTKDGRFFTNKIIAREE